MSWSALSQQRNFNAYAYESITPGDVATGISAANLKNSAGLAAKEAMIVGEDNTVNFTLHGADPTASAGTNVGMALAAGNSYIIQGYDNIAAFRCIDRVSGSAGTVKVALFT